MPLRSSPKVSSSEYAVVRVEALSIRIEKERAQFADLVSRCGVVGVGYIPMRSLQFLWALRLRFLLQSSGIRSAK